MADNRRVAQPSSTRPIVNDDMSPSTQLNTWFKVITDQSRIVGSGPPEGIVPASQLSMYMDEQGVTGSILYIKRNGDDGLGDTTKGWVLI